MLIVPSLPGFTSPHNSFIRVYILPPFGICILDKYVIWIKCTFLSLEHMCQRNIFIFMLCILINKDWFDFIKCNEKYMLHNKYINIHTLEKCSSAFWIGTGRDGNSRRWRRREIIPNATLGKIQGDGQKFLERFKSYFGSQISSQSLNKVHIYRLQPKSATKGEFYHIFVSLIVSSRRHGLQMVNVADEVLLGKRPR